MRNLIWKAPKPAVLDIIDRNRLIMQPFREVVDHALNNVSKFLIRGDTFSQQENDKVEQERRESVDSLLQIDVQAEDAVLLDDAYQVQSAGPVVIPDAELNFKTRSSKSRERNL